MIKIMMVALLFSLMNLTSALGCTTLFVTKGASENGSVFIAYSDDGYINTPEKTIQKIGYPKQWYDQSEWLNGPTTHKKTE